MFASGTRRLTLLFGLALAGGEAACSSNTASVGDAGPGGGSGGATATGTGGGSGGTGTGAGTGGGGTPAGSGGASAAGTGGAATAGTGGGASTGTGGVTSTGTGGAASGTGGRAGAAGAAGTGGRAAAGTGGTAVPDAGAPDAPAGTNPAPGQYGTRANLLAPNSEMAVGEAAGKIYIVGGYPSSPAASVSTVAAYTPATNAWALTTPYPFPIHHPVVLGVAGKLYSLGGQTPGADTGRSFEFDPAASTWRELAVMPTARGAGAAAAIGDKIYVVGGRPPANNQLEVYDVSDNAWMTLPPLPSTFPQRNHIIATAIGGKVYVAGGRYNGGGFQSPRTASLNVFDPATGMWSLAANMLDPPRGGLNGVAANGCFHIWGGEGSGIGFPNDVFPQHDVYDPRTNSWRRLGNLPTPVHGVTGAAFLDGIIYMPGGGTMSGGSSGSLGFQVYRPDPTMRCD